MSKDDKAAKGKKTQGSEATFREIGPGCYAYCVTGGVNTGVIVGDNGVLVIDAQPTAEAAEELLEQIAKVTDKPVKYVVLTHYHADSTQGAAALGAGEILSSDLTRRMIDERGGPDRISAPIRYPELFANGQQLPAQVRPTMTFASSISVDLGRREARIMHLGRGHTMGDVAVWVPESKVFFAGDLVSAGNAVYCGDAHLSDWPRALDRIAAFRPQAIMAGRGKAVVGAEAVLEAISTTQHFIGLLRDTAATCVQKGRGLKGTFTAVKEALEPLAGGWQDFERTLPFNVARAYDEGHGLEFPQVWTVERDRDLADALQGVIPQPGEQAQASEAGADETPETEDDSLELQADDIVVDEASAAQKSEAKFPEQAGA